jgi:ABC-type branched-subunit amino acid transport system substrate-binding protein
MNRVTSVPARAVTLGLSLVVAAASTLAAAPARADEVQPRREFTQRYDDAVAALMTQRYAAAYGRFAALADEGHTPSALMALALVRYRPSTVGGEWSATPAQLRRWSALAAQPLQQSAALLAEHDGGE